MPDSGARGTDTRGCLTSAKVMKNLDVSDSLVIRLLTTVLSNDCHCAGFARISSMRSSDLRCWGNRTRGSTFQQSRRPALRMRCIDAHAADNQND